MAIGFRSKTDVNFTSTASVTLAVPSGVVNGDVLIAMLFQGDPLAGVPSTWTDPLGWTLIGETTGIDAVNGGLGQVRSLIRVASSEPANYTWTLSLALTCGGAMAAYTGVDNTTPQDATFTAAHDGNGSNPDSPSITTVTDNAWVLSTFGCDFAMTIAPSNQTQRSLLTGGGGGLADALVTPAGAFNPGAWGNNPGIWGAQSIALRPVTGPPPVKYFWPIKQARQSVNRAGTY